MPRQNDPAVHLPASLLTARTAAKTFAHAARAENTKRAYKSSWSDFDSWCKETGVASLPATSETVALFVSDRAASLKVGTLGHRLAAIAVAHKLAGHPNPASKREEPLASIWSGIKRINLQRKTQKKPLLEPHLRQIIAAQNDRQREGLSELRWLRDRAVLLTGFAGALRRSELTAIKVKDLSFDDRGVRLYIPQSKTDADGVGAEIGIPATGTGTCPVRALKDWIAAAEIEDGRVFRAIRHGGEITSSLSSKMVANIVKAHAAEIGLDSDGFSGHSLRSGLITQAATAGAKEVDIMRHSRHKSVPILRDYIRKATVWEDNAASRALGG